MKCEEKGWRGKKFHVKNSAGEEEVYEEREKDEGKDLELKEEKEKETKIWKYI